MSKIEGCYVWCGAYSCNYGCTMLYALSFQINLYNMKIVYQS